MRVLFSVRSDVSRIFGGDIQYVVEVTGALRAIGVDVVVSHESAPSLDGVDLVNVVNTVNADETASRMRYFREARMPVVLTPEYWNLDRFFVHTRHRARIARRVLGERCALSLFRFRTRTSKWWHTLRDVMHTADRVIAKSQFEAETLIRDFAIGNDRIRLVKNGVDPQYGLGARAATFVERYGVGDFLLTVGRVEPRKNQLSLLRATHGMDTPVVFIGGGCTDSNEYYVQCKRMSAGRPVYFIDRLPHEQLAHAFAAARAHIAPSYLESTSLASLEALMVGCPVVVTRESPYEEYFGLDVITCDPYDILSIRQAVERVLRAPRVSAEKRSALIASLAWDRIAVELRKVYEEQAS